MECLLAWLCLIMIVMCFWIPDCYGHCVGCWELAASILFLTAVADTYSRSLLLILLTAAATYHYCFYLF